MTTDLPVFVVEDEALIAVDIRHQLEAIGYSRVLTFDSGEALLEHLRTERPVIILMDILLRGRLDGIETAELAMRRFDVPVIYVTAQSDRATYERAKKSMPYGFITKPLRTIDLYSSVDIAIDRHRARMRLRELSKRAEEIREQERMKIAREIHDEVGQSLTALKLELAHLRKSCAKMDRQYDEKISGMTDLVSGLIDTVRAITGELRPPMLDELGLVETMRSLCAKSERRSGISFLFTDSSAAADIDGRMTRFELVSIYRIFQESVTNVMRHSQGRECRVTLDCSGDVLQLTVFDDGRGIPPDRIDAADSYGLQGIRERAASFGWNVVIDATEGKGTGMILTVPAKAYETVDRTQ